MIEAYPLSWPAQWPREQDPQYSSFKTGLVQAQRQLVRELELLGATDIIISSNAQLNRYGEIAARQRRIDDTGVAVYFTLHGEQRCIPCDKWILLEDNVHAIELAVAALRGLERWGARQMVDAAFSGFAALPASSKTGWWVVLGVPRDATRDQIEREYRAWVKIHHPDVGGDPAQFREITEAYREGLHATRCD